MKKLIVLIVSIWFLIPPMVSGGEIRVYDDNDQFLGILLGESFKHSPAYIIFIPSLNVVTVILEETEAGIADIIRSHGYVYFEDDHCSGPAYLGTFLTAPNILYRFGSRDNSPKYFLGIAPWKKGFVISSKINFTGDCSHQVSSKYRHSKHGYRAVEISKKGIPFTLPVALPLTYEYAESGSIRGVSDSDGNAGAADLAKLSGKLGK